MDLLLTPEEALHIIDNSPITSHTNVFDFAERLCELYRDKNPRMDRFSLTLFCFYYVFQAGRLQGIREERNKNNCRGILKKLRGNRDIKTVATAVGISVTALTAYEDGKRTPRDEVKIALAAFYGKPVNDIF